MAIYKIHATNIDFARKLIERSAFPVHLEEQADGNFLAKPAADLDARILGELGLSGLDTPNFQPIKPPRPWGI